MRNGLRAGLKGGSEAAKDLLASEGYDPQFGIRPLKRVIQHEVENRVARAILDGTIRDGDTIEIDARDGKLVLTPVRPEAAVSQVK